MTIIDDLKAINKDIKKNRKFEKKLNVAKYWKIKLENIYPDYSFTFLYSDNFNVEIVANIKGVN